MVGNANANSIKMVVIKMVKSWVFLKNESEFAGEILFDKLFCGF